MLSTEHEDGKVRKAEISTVRRSRDEHDLLMKMYVRILTV